MRVKRWRRLLRRPLHRRLPGVRPLLPGLRQRRLGRPRRHVLQHPRPRVQGYRLLRSHHRARPKRRSCCERQPVLPVVRAILSWNDEPPPSQPNWSPIWGNRLQRHIQIDPRSRFLCHFVDILTPEPSKIDPALLKTLTSLLEAQPPVPKPVAPPPRTDAAATQTSSCRPCAMSTPPSSNWPRTTPTSHALKFLKALDIDISKFGDFMPSPISTPPTRSSTASASTATTASCTASCKSNDPPAIPAASAPQAAANTSPSTSTSAPAGNTRAQPGSTSTTCPSPEAASGTRRPCRSTWTTNARSGAKPAAPASAASCRGPCRPRQPAQPRPPLG